MWVQNHLKKPFKINKGYLIALSIIISILSITAFAEPKNRAQTIYFEYNTLS